MTDPTAADATPLIIATRHGNTPLVKALLRAKPDFNHRDRSNKSAMDYAKENHFDEIATLLTQHGGHN